MLITIPAHNDNIYSDLQQHLDKMPVGFPKTESGVEMRILKKLFTPIEAKIAMKLDWMPETFRQIWRKSKKIGISKIELRDHLEEMGNKGIIYSKRKGRRNYYRAAMYAIGIYEFQVERLSEELMIDIQQYWDHEFGDDVLSSKINQLRTVPVEKSLPFHRKIYNYENIKKLVRESSGPFGVAECICRKGKDLLRDPCKLTDLRESCLVFRETARLYINHGNAREIFKEESLQILENAEEEGLIIQPGNYRKLNFICTCCGCCCEDLNAVKKLANPVEVYSTNFFATVNESECIGCGTCVKRCQMDAIEIINEKAVVNLKRCIGCGVCTVKCPRNAIKLDKKKKTRKPPKSSFILFLKINNRINGIWSSIKMVLKMILNCNLRYLLVKNNPKEKREQDLL